MHPEFCSIIFRVHQWFCSLTIQGAPSTESTQYEVEYEHVLDHKGGARVPSALWLDPPLLANKIFSELIFTGITIDFIQVWTVDKKNCYIGIKWFRSVEFIIVTGQCLCWRSLFILKYWKWTSNIFDNLSVCVLEISLEWYGSPLFDASLLIGCVKVQLKIDTVPAFITALHIWWYYSIISKWNYIVLSHLLYSDVLTN